MDTCLPWGNNKIHSYHKNCVIIYHMKNFLNKEVEERLPETPPYLEEIIFK